MFFFCQSGMSRRLPGKSWNERLKVILKRVVLPWQGHKNICFFDISTCFQWISFFVWVKTCKETNRNSQQRTRAGIQIYCCSPLYTGCISQVLCFYLHIQGMRTVFKSDTMLRSHFVWPKDVLERTKQNGVIYKIPCECGQVYIGETGRSMRERIKEHDRDIQFACTQTSAVSEHPNKTGHIPIWREGKFIDRDPHWYTQRVKKAIHIRLHSNNINRDSGIEIPEAWTATIKQHNSHSKCTYEGTPFNSRNNNEDQNAPIAANHRATNSNT